MKRKMALIALLVLVGLLASCGTNLNKKNVDGSPIWTTIIPSSSRQIYGVGKAKLTLDANSEQAADTVARSNLSKKIESTMKEFNTQYTMDTEGKTAQAYEQLIVETVNLTLRKVTVEQRWRAGRHRLVVGILSDQGTAHRVLGDRQAGRRREHQRAGVGQRGGKVPRVQGV